MTAQKILHLKLLVLAVIIHQTLTNEGSNMKVGAAHQSYFLSLIGGEDIFSEKLTRKMEEFIAPTLKNSTHLCGNHSEVYISGLRNGTAWAYQMLDASAKLQSGILVGSLVSMGNFDECIAVRDVQTHLGTFSGKHCLASLTWENDSFRTAKELFNITTLLGGLKSLTVKWGFCIPSTCTAGDLVTGLKVILNQDITVSLSELDCHTDKAKELKTMDYVAIVLFTAFGLIVLLSTSYDLLKTEHRKEILVSFSLLTNGSKLLATKSSEGTLTCLHGFRFLSICWIVVGHRFMFSLREPSINAFDGYDLVREWSSMIIINSVMAVDTFLFLSGLLVAYVWLNHMDGSQEKRFNVPLYYLHRYLRLTPPLAALILLQVSLIEHLGSGPAWDKTNQILTEMCKDNWWLALLYVQNYFSGHRMCVGHSWFLSVNMQLFWLSPLLLMPLLKWPRRWSHLLLGVLILGGIVISFTITYVNNFPAGVMAGVGPEWHAKDQFEYVPTHTRFTPWVIGCGLGYLLHYNRNQTLDLTWLQVCTGWLLATACFFSTIYCLLPFQQPDYVYNALEYSIYNCLHRPIWSLAIGWVIYACVSGYGGPVNTLLSWKVFQPFGRLSYCIYLVHLVYQQYRTMTTRTSVYLSNMNIFTQATSDIVLSILLAALLSLVFESPAQAIEKFLLRKDRKQDNRREVTPDVSKKSVEEARVNHEFTAQDDR